ncbi:MAG: glycoside hydrolase family 25 protein [Aureispira sp.]|nr:glycoside hydrolase family 25 protein [Aureispira sp.]
MKFLYNILIALASFFSSSCTSHATNLDSTKYPIQGIDISHHQGVIDWKSLKQEAKVQFVFMKATEGGNFKDTKFQYNWKAAKEIGIRRGAYHFYSFCKAGAEQAANFISSVPIDKNALPPVVDLEFLGSCKKRPPVQEAIKEIQIFLDLLEKQYGKPPILYTTYAFYEVYLKEDLTSYDLWLRDIQKEPILENRNWKFWQFSNRGTRKGIKGNVDLNVFYGNIQSFNQY